MDFSCVILAAGRGTRMKSEKPKVLHEILSKPIIDWVIDAAFAAGGKEICVVTGFQGDEVREHLFNKGVVFARQEEITGTARAVAAAEDFIKKSNVPVIILCGDTPLITKGTLEKLVGEHISRGNSLTLLTALSKNPHGYGRIIIENETVREIVEEKDATDEQRKIKEINTGIYCFEPGCLLDALSKVKNDNAKGEYYLTDTVKILSQESAQIGSVTCDEEEVFGINDRLALANAEQAAQKRINQSLMLEGVTIHGSESVFIGPDVKVGKDTEIFAPVWISGASEIGKDSKIGPNSKITNSKLGAGTIFNASQIVDSKAGDGCVIGPYAYIRPGCVLGNHVKIGDFVELKNSTIGDGTKVPHLTYVGDADIGARVNFGCGCVVVNFDGEKKHRTTVDDDAFIGCNTNLVSPVHVGKDSYIAAGSTITDEVPDMALAIARARQVNKEGWVEKRRGKK